MQSPNSTGKLITILLILILTTIVLLFFEVSQPKACESPTPKICQCPEIHSDNNFSSTAEPKPCEIPIPEECHCSENNSDSNFSSTAEPKPCEIPIPEECHCPENNVGSYSSSSPNPNAEKSYGAYEWRENYGYSWIEGNVSAIPANAVLAGQDTDGKLIYAGKSFYNNLVPAKVVAHKDAYVTWSGSEVVVSSNFEVLCGPPVAWQIASRGEVPPNAIPIIARRTGEKVYVGRALHQCSITLGKILPGEGLLYIPYGEKEIIKKEFEVMVYPSLPPY